MHIKRESRAVTRKPHNAVPKPWKSTFSIIPLSFDAPFSREPPRIPTWTLYCQNLESFGYMSVGDSVVLSSFKFAWWALKDVFFKQSQGRRNRWFWHQLKAQCSFLLFINSNTSPMMPRLRDNAGFLQRRSTPPLFHPKFGVFPLDYRLPMLWLRGAKTVS